MKIWFLILLFISPYVYAASTPDHFIQNFLITGYGTKLFSNDRTTILYSAVIGGIIGMAPDLIGMTGPHGLHHWVNYTWAHSSDNPLRFIPQYGFHLLVDRAFHEFPGDKWWPRMTSVCIVMWFVEGVLTYVLFKYVLPK